jgi:hypothetical protein
MAAKADRTVRRKRAKKTTSHARRKSSARRKRASPQRWSARVTRESNALDLQGGVFKLNSPKAIAASLKRSAERSKRRKSNPYRSALSMLTFYINRAGKNLSASRKKKLNQAKAELKVQFGRA